MTAHLQFEISNLRSEISNVRSHARSAARAGGFTLIELLTTIALLAVVLPAVVSGINLALSAGGLAREQATAAALAQDKMAQLLAENQWQQPTLAGDFAPDRPEYLWQGQLQDWDGTLRQLDVTVTWVSSNPSAASRSRRW